MQLLKHLLGFFFKRSGLGGAQRKSPRGRLLVEVLEDRSLMSAGVLANDVLVHDGVRNAFGKDRPAVSATTLSASTVTSTSTLDPSLPPSGNFDLSHWNLTLPTGISGKPNVITTSSLTNGYTSQYFYTGTDGAMVFWCPVTGVTTSGSTYPRTELRETRSDGSNYNWNMSDGSATLSGTLAVNQVPSTGRVVVAQIHDNGAGGIKSEPLLMLVYKYNSRTGTGSLIAEVRATPTSSTVTKYTLATGIDLNTQFSFELQLQADRTLSVKINGVTQYSAAVDSSWQSQGLYFKAGAYVLDNSGLSTEGGQVSFYALTATHT